jgi:hypothetical protein
MKIEGIPDGWELVRIGNPKKGEYFLDEYNMPVPSGTDYFLHPKPIVRKIERPKQYRPFANAEEFKPHRNRWWKWNPVKFPHPVKFPPNRNYPPLVYDDNGHGAETWEQNFRDKVFDDGTPFGVEVNE